MKIKWVKKASSRPEKIRNYITGSLVWAAVIGLVFFVILEVPSYRIPFEKKSVSEESTAMSGGSESESMFVLNDATQTASIGKASTDVPESTQSSATNSNAVLGDSTSQSTGTNDSGTETLSSVDSITSGSSERTENKPSKIIQKFESTPTIVNPPTVASGTSTDSSAEANTQPKTSKVALYIQVAAFRSEKNARNERTKYSRALYPSTIVKNQTGLMRVLIGPYLTEAEAKKVQNELVKKFNVEGSTIHNMKNEAPTESTANVMVAETNSKPTEEASENPVMENGWYVQAGAFKDAGYATLAHLRVTTLNLPAVVTRGEGPLSLLYVGPFSSKSEAEEAKILISAELKIKDAIVRNIST